MSARSEMTERLADYLGSSVSGMSGEMATETARVVTRLLVDIRRDVTEVDTTTLGSADRTVLWHRLLVGELAFIVDHGPRDDPDGRAVGRGNPGGVGPMSADYGEADDPRYGTCDECDEVGFEVVACPDCGADICPFCHHDDCEERE